jgi:hypothetical protein
MTFHSGGRQNPLANDSPRPEGGIVGLQGMDFMRVHTPNKQKNAGAKRPEGRGMDESKLENLSIISTTIFPKKTFNLILSNYVICVNDIYTTRIRKGRIEAKILRLLSPKAIHVLLWYEHSGTA